MKPQAIVERQAAATKPTSMGRKIADIDRQQIHRLMPATRGANRRFHTRAYLLNAPARLWQCRVGLVTNIHSKIVALACSPVETSDLCSPHETRVSQLL
jgi:hypothetical protein